MDLASSRTKVSLDQTQYLAAVASTMGTRLGAAINFIIDNLPSGPGIGTIQPSMLTLVQFQAIKGAGWVLCDGANVTGSAYQTSLGFTNVPDLRNRFFRGKNHARSTGTGDPDGDLALGTFRSNKIKSHSHTATYVTNRPIAHTNSTFDQDAGGERYNHNPFIWPLTSYNMTTQVLNSPPSAYTEIAAEMRPMNIAVNFFIRIN